MDQVFNHLIKRATPQPIVKVGTPWQCIPIKNDKQARDTTEVHMSNQGFNELAQFDKFMNLEVVWLNENQLTSIKGIEQNFRIKHLYLQKNKISTLEGLQNLKHLETLSLFNNELRDLEKNLLILKEFPGLTTLDLFNNPVAEEPYYRNRVISALPQLQLLDRSIITVQEKIKVEAWYKDFKAEVKIKKKGQKKQKLLPSQIFSVGEKILYKEVDEIKAKREQEKADEIERERTRIKQKEKTFDPNKFPTNELKEQLRQRLHDNPMSLVNEWEKGKLKKIFKSYDKEKKGSIQQDKLQGLYGDLMNDIANIGKVPAVTFEKFKEIMSEDPLPWDSFCFQLNHVDFQRAPEEMLQKKIDEKYKEFNRRLNAGKKAEAKEFMIEAVRLEAARDKDEHKLPEIIPDDNTKIRSDCFDFSRYKYKQNFTDTAKYLLQ
ncbi:unnamed protein product [Paramecium primaurelia]|uniref:EF-hand domain-containing protein n=1 Tax=Paramecium primaurelia TaxID=5886 RepID=A0A8S1JNN4_PARPR|nr:unnamed protein product [Paramecium primaurelia]